VAFARSQTAHARVAGIDVARAREAPGVEAVVVASDFDTGPLVPPLDNVLAVATPRPLLGEGAVRFVGEPVAAVCADSRYAAEDAAELVDLDLEPLPVVADLDAAAADEVVVDGYASNVIFDNRIQTGDVDAAFAHAAAVVERTFVNPRYAALPIESRGMQAAPEGDGVRIWAST
jgi:carbon-monoxide dehydrogenase large subunit